MKKQKKTWVKNKKLRFCFSLAVFLAFFPFSHCTNKSKNECQKLYSYSNQSIEKNKDILPSKYYKIFLDLTKKKSICYKKRV